MNQPLEDVIKVRQGVKFGGAGKIEEMLTRPQFSLPRTAVLVLKIAFIHAGGHRLPANKRGIPWINPHCSK